MVPLLLHYDTTHEGGAEDSKPPQFDMVGSENRRGPGFLGLGVERSNMQVLHWRTGSLSPLQPSSCSNRYDAMKSLVSIMRLTQQGQAKLCLVSFWPEARFTLDLQAARNYHAMLAARALARLAGVLAGGLASPPCPPAQEALGKLLTPALAGRLTQTDPRPLLTLLNSSVLTPQAGLPILMCLAV